MKKTFTKILLGMLMLIGMSVSLSSCDDDYWYPDAPMGWDTFNDQRLTGNWELMQVNASPVDRYDVNYLRFNGSGRGRYYYYDRGELYGERIAYWCQRGYGSNHNQINIQYENGQASTMDYWFSNNNNVLWMSWRTDRGTVTYLYQYIDNLP